MKLLFCTSKLPVSVAIRVFTWSDWSHVAIIDGDEIIEAVWPKVRVSKLEEAKNKYKSWVIAEVKTRNDAEIIKAARSQVGKPYDIGAIFGFVARRDWEKTDKWFCSELVAWAFARGNEPLFRPSTFSRVTPQHIWMITDTFHRNTL
jgi:uncharacterized protein YycO